MLLRIWLTKETADMHQKLRTLLDHAQEAAKRVSTDVTFQRQDLAFVEYLVCQEILLNIVPRHKDYPAMQSDHGEKRRMYTELYKVSFDHAQRD